MNFPVKINRNNNISPFDTEATFSCMSKACFDKIQPKSRLVQTNMCNMNGAVGNSLGSIGMATCTLEFPKKLQQQFIVCKHLL